MQLYLEPLRDELYQRMKPDSNKQVMVVRPHLYIRNIPTGSVKVQICTEDDALIGESNSLMFSEITDSNEYHGYVRFDVSAHLKKDVYYKFKVVVGDGYEYSDSSYCGVVLDQGFKIYDHSQDNVPAYLRPLDLQVWSRSFR